MGTKGFSGTQSILYHHYMPTEVGHAALSHSCQLQYEEDVALSHRHFRTKENKKSGDAVSGRNFILGNEDLLIGVVSPTEKWTISTVMVMAMKCCLSITEQEKLKRCLERFIIEKAIM